VAFSTSYIGMSNKHGHSKYHTHKRLDELFEEIRIYYAGIVSDLEERLANPLKQFGLLGKPVKATADTNLKNQEDCLKILNSLGLGESKRLYSLTRTTETTPDVYKNRKKFAHEFRKLLVSVFSDSDKVPDTPCYKLTRVANIMLNKRTGKSAYDIDSIRNVVKEYEDHEHRDRVSPSEHHDSHRPGDGGGGLGEQPATEFVLPGTIPMPPKSVAFVLPGTIPMPPKSVSNAAAASATLVALPAQGGRRRTRKHSKTHRRRHPRKTRSRR
jgi:hypothetical protein